MKTVNIRLLCKYMCDMTVLMPRNYKAHNMLKAHVKMISLKLKLSDMHYSLMRRNKAQAKQLTSMYTCTHKKNINIT